MPPAANEYGGMKMNIRAEVDELVAICPKSKSQAKWRKRVKARVKILNPISPILRERGIFRHTPSAFFNATLIIK